MAIKIEVGKVYINNISDKYKILFHDEENNYFYGSSLSCSSVHIYFEDGRCKTDGRDLFKEHKEPFKNTIERWISYVPNEEIDCREACDVITGKFTDGIIYETKESAKEKGKYLEVTKIKITVEEIIN